MSGNNELSEARAPEIAAHYRATVAELAGIAKRSQEAMNLRTSEKKLQSVGPNDALIAEFVAELDALKNE